MAPRNLGKAITKAKIQFLGQKSMVNGWVDYGAEIKEVGWMDGWKV